MTPRITVASHAAATSLLLATTGVAGADEQTVIPYQHGDP